MTQETGPLERSLTRLLSVFCSIKHLGVFLPLPPVADGMPARPMARFFPSSLLALSRFLSQESTQPQSLKLAQNIYSHCTDRSANYSAAKPLLSASGRNDKKPQDGRSDTTHTAGLNVTSERRCCLSSII